MYLGQGDDGKLRIHCSCFCERVDPPCTDEPPTPPLFHTSSSSCSNCCTRASSSCRYHCPTYSGGKKKKEELIHTDSFPPLPFRFVPFSATPSPTSIVVPIPHAHYVKQKASTTKNHQLLHPSTQSNPQESIEEANPYAYIYVHKN